MRPACEVARDLFFSKFVMTKKELEQLPAWLELGPAAPLRYCNTELVAARREHYPDKHNPDREAVILRSSPLGLCIDFTDRRGLENNPFYYNAKQDSLIIFRKDGRDYYPSTAVAKDGCIVLM